ncbi:MAG: diguanylate cyclase [Deltaproteobacteria bacterium]|nr:diguanylate cyclase [Deltaproteobacteria bacterium]
MEQAQFFLNFLQHSGKDPSRLIFEDELTGIYNRRFLYQYLQSKVRWDSLEERPFSLIMMDVDNFKQINDMYGHQVGDRALIWVAELLKEVAAQDVLPVRYAGDEFMLLLHRGKEDSMRTGNRLRKRILDNSFRPHPQDRPIRITLSIGIASAPEDARTSKGLIQKADTALYSAKKRGRNCCVNASEVTLHEVFDKTAIYQLRDMKLVGRSSQLSRVNGALKTFTRGKNQFLLVEGSSGLGKTEFLEAIRQSLASKKIFNVKVSGSPQEMFRPYYLTTKILVEILNRRRDKGAKVLENLGDEELYYLGQVLPQIGGEEKAPGEEDDAEFREGIFTTLLQFFPKVLERRPTILLIDDFHFSDEATMLLLRSLFKTGSIPLFLCCAFTPEEAAGKERQRPLELFTAAYGKELGLEKITLTPLTAEQIATHIEKIFPNVARPPDFEKHLADITNGNPLFIGEILRKLVTDQQITLVGQKWVIRPIKEDYLPKSLEEMVAQKIAAMDEENRRLLEQISALGEEVSLSMLIGSSGTMEAKVLDFIDQAVTQGILQSDFQLNDEVIRFLGKRVLEIAYGAIDRKRRQELHEQIGKYQEDLYQRRLLTSEATVAYHFKRSPDKEKAKSYEQLLAASNEKRFNASEAVLYSAEVTVEEPGEDTPLDADGIARLPDLIREFMIAVRNIRLYPPGSRSIIGVTQKLKNTIDGILRNNDCLNIMHMEQSVVVNGQKIVTKDFKVVARDFLRLLDQLQLRGIAFLKGLEESEVELMLEELGRTEQETLDERHWERFMIENRLEHIDLKQIRYKRHGDGESRAVQSKAAPEAAQDESSLLLEIFRALLSADRTIKLYPLESRAIGTIVEKLTKALRLYMKGRGILTLSRAEDALLVNGEKVAHPQLKPFAEKFRQYLGSVGLSSITFLREFREGELKSFFGALARLPEGVDAKFWKDFARQTGLSGILFDRHLYEVRVAETKGSSAAGETLSQTEAYAEHPQAEEVVEGDRESFSALLEGFQERIKEMLLNKEERPAKETLQRIFTALPQQETRERRRVPEMCNEVMEELSPALQQDFAKLLAGPLLGAFSKEEDPDLTLEMAALLNQLVTLLIQFVEYPTAARILSHLRRRQKEFEDSRHSQGQILAKAMEKKLDSHTRRLLLEDLRSSDPSRLRNAAQLLAAIGQGAVPFLIDLIKQEDDYRARKVAALLLKRQGSSAAQRLKEMLVLEVSPEERARILDVIDGFTSDLRKELLHALGDEDPRVREAGLRLAERLNNQETVDLLLDLAKTQRGTLAVSAIKCLGKIHPPNIDETLIQLLESTRDEHISIVCCRALGQIASPAAIDPLRKLLVTHGFFPFRKRRSPDLRATAAFALSQISHPQAAQVLAGLVDDPDARIREVARSKTLPKQPAQQQ